jgi:hypothetical protein
VHADIADNIVRLEHDLDSMMADVRTARDRGELDHAYARLLEGAVRVQLAACHVEELRTGVAVRQFLSSAGPRQCPAAPSLIRRLAGDAR